MKWSIINTGKDSRTGGIDINLGIASLSVGKDGIQAEVLNVANMTSVGAAITWGGPEAERGINLNYSTLLGDTNIGIQDFSLYANTEIATFGVGFSLGKTTGVGAHWAFGEAYIGTDATVVYSTFNGGYYQDNRTGKRKDIPSGPIVRLGGKYVGPNWTANGWGQTKYYHDDWDEWPIAYSMFDHAARIHDEKSNWDDPNDNNEEILADKELVANSWKALFFSPRASDKIKAGISIVYFSQFGSLYDWDHWVEKLKLDKIFN